MLPFLTLNPLMLPRFTISSPFSHTTAYHDSHSHSPSIRAPGTALRLLVCVCIWMRLGAPFTPRLHFHQTRRCLLPSIFSSFFFVCTPLSLSVLTPIVSPPCSLPRYIPLCIVTIPCYHGHHPHDCCPTSPGSFTSASAPRLLVRPPFLHPFTTSPGSCSSPSHFHHISWFAAAGELLVFPVSCRVSFRFVFALATK